MKINLAMIVRNEERCLRRSLEAAASFVDDIIIVDTGSTDQTKKIARSFGKTSGKCVLLYDFAWKNDFSAARNFSLFKSETDGGADYSLVIDADERLRTTKLSNREELEAFIHRVEAEQTDNDTTSKSSDSGAEQKDSADIASVDGADGNTAAADSEKQKSETDTDASEAVSDAKVKKTARGQGAWCGTVRLIEERKSRKGDPITCLTIVPRLLPRGVRYHGIICETPAIQNANTRITDSQSPDTNEAETQDSDAEKDNVQNTETGSSAIMTPLLVDHDTSDREARTERKLPYLIRAISMEPEDPYWKLQIAVVLSGLQRTEESLPYFDEFYRMIKARYPDVTDQSEYREPYARQGILTYLYALDDMRGEKYRQRALHILLRQEPHMHNSADFYFFCGEFFMELVQTRTQRYITYLPRVEQSFVRCLQIGENTEDSVVIGNGSFRAFYRLGVWYELTNQPQHARACYESAAQMGYEPAVRRMGMYRR